MRLDARIGIGVGGFRQLLEHVLGQRENDGTRPSARGDVEGAAHELGHARGIVDFVDPFRDRAEDGAVVELLERLATLRRARHLADEEDERRRILARDVQAGAGVAGAGAARDEAHARPPGELAVSLGHDGGAAFLAAGDEADGVGVVHRIERREIAFAGHAEHRVGAVDLELVDQDFGAGAAFLLAHVRLPGSSIGWSR